MMNLEILYESPEVVAVNKPAGLLTHTDDGSEQESVETWFKDKYPQAVSVGEKQVVRGGVEVHRSGVVHRLDRDTSGVIILAKTDEVYQKLKQQFQVRSIQKNYLAYVHGHLKEELGTIDVPIGRSPRDHTKWLAGINLPGRTREAVTKFKMLARGVDDEQPWSLLQLEPKTGRTHQLRVHLKYLQRPIIGDPVYAASYPLLLGFTRLALHAEKITFTLNQKEITVTAPLPADFLSAAQLASGAHL